MEKRIRRGLTPDSELRAFGLALAVALGLMFGVVFPWLGGRAWPLWPWLASAGLITIAAAAPQLLRWLHLPWMRLARLIGALITPIVAAVIYFLIITPVGWLRRVFGGDPMRRGFDSGAASYRVPSTPAPPGKMEKPY